MALAHVESPTAAASHLHFKVNTRLARLGAALAAISACTTQHSLESLRADADSLAMAYAASGRWHGGLLVANGSSIIYRGATGLADRATGAPNTPETRFDIGSISKPFTAIIVLQLVESGDLALHGTIRDYLPEYAGRGADRITIHHLLSHTSGIPDYVAATPGYFQELPNYDEETLLARMADRSLDFEPGQGFAYSNTNYVLLGAIVAAVTAQPFPEVLEARIFAPLGMHSSEWSAHPDSTDGSAVRYRGDEVAMSERMHMGDSGIVTTLDDLHRFAMAIGSTDLLTQESWSLVFAPHADPSLAAYPHPAHRFPYGYGFSLSTIRRADGTSARVVLHGGTGLGASAMLMKEVDGGGLVLLWNNIGGLSRHMQTTDLYELAVRAGDG